MEWTEETISHLRSLWDQGLSTAEIGRRMSITKNAVVGKAHRLVLPARPSPIRKVADGEQPASRREPGRASRRAVPDQAGQQAARVVTPFPKPAPAMASHGGGDLSDRTEVPGRPIPDLPPSSPLNATVTPIRPVQSPPPAREPDLAPSPRSISSVEPRRRGLTCCWPIGEPGTKQFHFCGGEPLQGKPYCSAHSQLAYVKLRDRRDTVA